MRNLLLNVILWKEQNTIWACKEFMLKQLGLVVFTHQQLYFLPTPITCKFQLSQRSLGGNELPMDTILS
jgi:hypothetical protein